MALAASRQGILAGYWTGVPCFEPRSRFAAARIWRRYVRYGTVPLREDLVALNPVVPLSTRLATAFLPSPLAKRVEQASYVWFDRWVAGRLRAAAAKVFVGYESSSLESFRMAKSLGMTTVLDAASIHHAAQDALHGFVESHATHANMVGRKDAEIQLADMIITASDVARETYLAGGVAPRKVEAISLGADLELFGRCDSRTEAAPFRFIFVGALSLRKGVDLLIDAFSAVSSEVADAELVLVGGPSDASGIVARAGYTRIRALGPLSQAELAVAYCQADCLVLPSRNDSFGMVVPEALAAGLPALVTEMVGAKSAIQEDVNGWVIPVEDARALRERMLWCANNRATVRSMRETARHSARALSWESYHERIGTFLRGVIQHHDSLAGGRD